MATIGAYFSPDHVCEREDTQASNLIWMMQLQTAQTELQEVRSKNRQLSKSLCTETRRTDKLEVHVIHLKDKVEELKAENHNLKDDL
jgi:hypothetical protein